MEIIMPKISRMILFTLCVLCFSAAASGDSVDIGETTAWPGTTVRLPVWIDLSGAAAACNLRIEYDEALLENPSAERGRILDASRQVVSHTPEPGHLNVLVKPAPDLSPLPVRSGEIVELVFRIKDGVSTGSTAVVTFVQNTPETPAFPSAGFSDASGQSLSGHALTAGAVTVGQPTSDARAWVLY